MPIRLTANPDIGPRGWNRQCFNTLDMAGIAQPTTVAVHILKTGPVHVTTETGFVVEHVFQMGESSQLLGRDRIHLKRLSCHIAVVSISVRAFIGRLTPGL